MKQLSGKNMTMEYDIINITEPVTTVTLEEENGYYLSPDDMADYIKPYIINTDYDHIYVVARFRKYYA